ncbi:hypothetical protein AAF302_000689 [Pluralibacter gergoviae]
MTSKLTRKQLQTIIESADAVITALEGTNDSKMCQLWDALNDRYAPPEIVKYMAERLLSCVESEPVYQCEFCYTNDAGERQWFWEDVNQSFYEQYGYGRKGSKRVLYTSPQPASAVPVVGDDIGEIHVGHLPTMNQDDYPGLGAWWVQLRIGEGSDEVLARVYGATPQEANNRAEALASRAAMLNHMPDATKMTDHSPDAGNKVNSPEIPEGWTLVPVEPTNAMINAWLSEVANWRGHVAGYKAMLAAAPQEVKGE